MNHRNQSGACRGWTLEEVREAKRLQGLGLSATEVGEKIGRTRNAVLGKMHREGAAPAIDPALVESLEVILGSRAHPAVMAHSAAMRVAA